ncbi:hypothetical protein THAOC_29005, partial [Thalassiosira oceanica]
MSFGRNTQQWKTESPSTIETDQFGDDVADDDYSLITQLYAPDPPGIYDSDATSGERGLESIASTEISSLPTTEHSHVACGSGGLDPPSRAFPTDNGVDNGDGQLAGDPQQQQSCLDPPFIETVENKQSTCDHELVTEPSIIQQHLIIPSVPSSLGGHALEVQHLTMTMPFAAGVNLSQYANESLPSTLPIQLMSFPFDGEDFLASAGCESDETVLCLRWEVEDELQWEAEIEANDADERPKEIEINDADESLQEIEVDDGLPSLSSPSSLRTNTKPTNDDAICDDTSSMPDDRVSEGDEHVVGPTPVNDDALLNSDGGVYVPEGEVYYMNGDRLADDDSQLPFGFSVDDVEIPSADLQCELPMSEFQVWSKVIRSCGLSLEVEADSPQPAIEFSRNPLGARRFLGLPLRNATCLLASTPCSSALTSCGDGAQEGNG